MVEFHAETVRQLILVGSLLAGFAFSATLQVMQREPKEGRPWNALCAALLLLCSFTFLVSVLVGVFLLHSRASGEEVRNEDVDFFFSSFLVASAIFLAGVALAGWVYSWIMGLFVTIVVMVAAFILGPILVR